MHLDCLGPRETSLSVGRGSLCFRCRAQRQIGLRSRVSKVACATAEPQDTLDRSRAAKPGCMFQRCVRSAIAEHPPRQGTSLVVGDRTEANLGYMQTAEGVARPVCDQVELLI